MLSKKMTQYKKITAKLLSEKVTDKSGELLNVYQQASSIRKKVLKLAAANQTPFYLFDSQGLNQAIKEFKTVFSKYIPNYQAYYAMKANPYPGLLKTVVNHGLGIDVSSGRELAIALKCGAKKLIFTGPGKTEAELQLAIQNRDKLIILMDSFGELARLGKMLNNKNIKVRAGIRIFTKFHGPWTKFGIDLNDLTKFWQEARKYPQIELQGIHCHMSWGESAKPYIDLIALIGKYLKLNFSQDQLAQIKFIDLGGGFLPVKIDGYYPWTLPQGEIIKIAAETVGQKAEYAERYYLTEAATLASYARGIGEAIKKNFGPLKNCQYFFEPGRILAAKSMHLVFRVLDVKSKEAVILDAGMNMIGWDSYQYNYCPVINLTHPAAKEIKVSLFGSLCAPEDIFGYYCFASMIKEGDVLIIPNQGAYTFTFAQNFIKAIPPVVTG